MYNFALTNCVNNKMFNSWKKKLINRRKKRKVVSIIDI